LTLPSPNAESVAVRLATSRPVVMDGTIRHELRLKLVVERVAEAV
jgi:hypothetical protein